MYDICFVIPTYNRLEQIKRSIAQIIDTFEKNKINYFIFLVDNSSNNETENFFINFQHPNLKYTKRLESIPNGDISLHKVLTEVDVESKWYWWMGDDDYVVPQGVDKLKAYLNDSTLDYIHATDLTYLIVEDDVKKTFSDLIIQYGFMELLSFMSSQIFTQKILKRMQLSINSNLNSRDMSFNFNHGLFLCENLWFDSGVILGCGAVVAQMHLFGHEVTHDTNRENKNFLEPLKGWFNLSDNLNIFQDRLDVKFPINNSFFNYRGRPIWSTFEKWILNYGLVTNMNVDESDYLKICKLISLGNENIQFELDFFNVIYFLNESNRNSSVEYKNKVSNQMYENLMAYLN